MLGLLYFSLASVSYLGSYNCACKKKNRLKFATKSQHSNDLEYISASDSVPVNIILLLVDDHR